MSSRHHPPEVPAAVTGMKLRAPFSLGSMVGFWAGGGAGQGLIPTCWDFYRTPPGLLQLQAFKDFPELSL